MSLLKLILLGDSSVGKTSIIHKLSHPTQPLPLTPSATMGIEFDTRTFMVAPNPVDGSPQDAESRRRDRGKPIKTQLWDTAGQERFARVLLPTYFRRVRGCILMFSLTDVRSFENAVGNWYDQITKHCAGSTREVKVVLVGNKSDLKSAASGGVSLSDRAAIWARGKKIMYYEASARSGVNVEVAFQSLIESIVWAEEESADNGMSKKSSDEDGAFTLREIRNANSTARSISRDSGGGVGGGGESGGCC